MFKHRPIPKHRNNARGIQKIESTFTHEDHSYYQVWNQEEDVPAADENQDPNSAQAENSSDFAQAEDSSNFQEAGPEWLEVPGETEDKTSEKNVEKTIPMCGVQIEDTLTSIPARNPEEVVVNCPLALHEENLRLKRELDKTQRALKACRKLQRKSTLEANKLKAPKKAKKLKKKIFKTEEIRKGLRIRFSCGRTGYKTVREELPEAQLPSLDTLYRHTRQHKYAPGRLIM